MGSFSIWHWLVVLAIVILIFGTKKIKNLGQDLGEAIRSFKEALNGNSSDSNSSNNTTTNNNDSDNKPQN